MQQLPYSHLEKGALLIATPEIDSGLFFRAVVLICEHQPTGSFGICLNKPLEVEIPEEVLTLNDLCNRRVKVRQGGPVQSNQMLLLHTSSRIPQETLEVCKGVFLGGDLDFLQESILNENGPEIFLCFGYSGWGTGQLEREFLDGQWFLAPASKELIFDTPSEKLWQTLLRQMGGKYATISMIPEDLSVN